MGTMNKMRENTGIVLWILVFAFGVIWVLQDSGGLDVVGNASGTNIIVVDGDPITYEEYARALDAQTQRYQEQTGESMPPQMVDQQREFVFQQLVENKLREHEMDRLGVEVTEEEIYNMILGPEPHQIIRVYFGDEEGHVNRALLQNFIDNPEARHDWIQIENYLRSERRREKMDNLIAATVRISDQEVVEEYRKRNLRVDVEWVGLRYSDLPNDSVTVTERDLRRFYDRNKDDFRRNRTYSLKYVTRTKEPSAEDSTLIREELTRIRQRFAEAEDDSLFLARNASERPFNDSWIAANDLHEELAEAIFENPQPGRLVGPVFAGDEGHVAKIRDVRPAENEVARARHILLRSDEDDAAVEQQLASIKQQITSGDATFEEMARRHSADGTASRGGDLGWFGRGQMVDQFESAAFGARVGEVVGPVRTRFGYHLIRVDAKSQQEVKIADYAMTVRPDIGTLNRMQEQLEDLRYFADENGRFDDEAQRLGLETMSAQVEADQTFIPGLGNSRSIMNFLERAKKEQISDVIELDDAYVVVYVEDITPEGHRPFDQVTAEIEPRVYIEKKRELLSQRMQNTLDRVGFDGLAEALGTQTRTAADITFNTSVISGIGREPKFVGTALGLDEGETSGVIGGENAVFVVKAANVEEPAPITESQKRQLRDQLLQQRRSNVQNQWLTSLREKANVQDLRRRFEQR